MNSGPDAGRECERRQRSGPEQNQHDRGQTTLGFALGASIFLVALLAVFLFVPGTIGPFLDGGQEQLVSSNRVASTLAEGLLGDPATPHRLDTTCTRLFFNGSAAPNCRFDDSTALNEMVGLSSDGRVNVSLRGNLSAPDGIDQLCWNGGGLVEGDDNPCSGARMAVGDAPPVGIGSPVVARRIVTVNATQVSLRVVTW